MANNYGKLIFNDFKKLWSGLDSIQKLGMLALAGITLVAATFILLKSAEPNWVVLYSDLTENDTVSVSESLKKAGYPVKVSKDHKAVLVPANMQDDLRLYVAENDLIQDKTEGFELLDNLQLGSTDFKNQLTKQRIFQGEITRSIEKINGISKARVQIAQAERSVFSDNDDAPTASVVLILDPGFRIKTDQVKAIKNLVAYSIPRLTPDRVFLTDQNGNSLTDEVGKNSSDIETYKANLENQTSKKVQAVIEKIVGKGNVSVQVSADIDFNSAKSTIESYIPAGENAQGVLTSQQSESEVYDNPNAAPAAAETAVKNKNLNYQKQKNLTNYSVSKEIKQVIYAPGSVKRMTIAVAVNKILTTTEREELQKLIITASGADIKRGDEITVSSLQFSGLADEKAAQEAIDKQVSKSGQSELLLTQVAPLAVILILGLAALFVLRSFFTGAGGGGGAVIAYSPHEEGMSGGGGGGGAAEFDYYPAIREELTDLSDIESLPQLEAKLDPELERIKSDLNDTILSDAAEATRLLISYIKD